MRTDASMLKPPDLCLESMAKGVEFGEQ